jgi:hypothetical protein
MKDIIRMNQLAGIITEGQARKMMEILTENELQNIPENHPLKKDIENIFDTTLESYSFKLDEKNKLAGNNIDNISGDTGIDPNKITSLVRGMIRKNPSKYSEIKMEKGGGLWPEKYKKAYSSLEELDPDSYIVVKLK